MKIGLSARMGTVVASVVLAMQTSRGAPFEAQFRVERITGDCQVKPPGAMEYAAAEAGKAYPYGTAVKTGEKSTATLVLSADNECALHPCTRVTLGENPTDSKVKQLTLDDGRVDISLEKGFQASNGFDILTPVAAGRVLGSKVSVACRTHETGIQVAGAFSCTEGLLAIDGQPYFSVPHMDDGDQLTIARSPDRSYFYLRNAAGEYEIEVKGADGNPRLIRTRPNVVIKIFVVRAPKEDRTVVTTTIRGAEEGKPESEETWTYYVPTGEAPRPPERPPILVEEEEEELLPTVIPTTTTTTTTVPSPTPVGER